MKKKEENIFAWNDAIQKMDFKKETKPGIVSPRYELQFCLPSEYVWHTLIQLDDLKKLQIAARELESVGLRAILFDLEQTDEVGF